MQKYNDKYVITDERGNIHTAFFRKGEDYDWWEDSSSSEEIKGVVKCEEFINGINYNKLLDDWAEELYKLIDKAKDEKNQSKFGTSSFYLNDGFIKGIAIAISQLNLMERKLKRSMKV